MMKMADSGTIKEKNKKLRLGEYSQHAFGLHLSRQRLEQGHAAQSAAGTAGSFSSQRLSLHQDGDLPSWSC